MKDTTRKIFKRIEKYEQRIIISAIGTGGHYFPAMTVAREFLQRGMDVTLLVRKGYAEEKIACMKNLKTFSIISKGFFGRSLFSKITALCVLIYSTTKLASLVKKGVGIAFGGFGALPLILACLIYRRSFFLFEPNRVPGRATKYFSAKAEVVFLGLPLAVNINGRSWHTGVPIRKEFTRVAAVRKAERRTNKKILFLGGSGGARAINELALQVSHLLPSNFEIVIISGTRDYDWVNARSNGRTKVISFTLLPWEEMKKASVIVSRAGALAGYEILSTNIPAIFIPFPHAIDDHQYYNAEYFAEVGNAIVIRQDQATGKTLVKKLEQILKKHKELNAIAFNAEKRIVDAVLKETV